MILDFCVRFVIIAYLNLKEIRLGFIYTTLVRLMFCNSISGGADLRESLLWDGTSPKAVVTNPVAEDDLISHHCLHLTI